MQINVDRELDRLSRNVGSCGEVTDNFATRGNFRAFCPRFALQTVF